jgi:hypothetical protein
MTFTKEGERSAIESKSLSQEKFFHQSGMPPIIENEWAGAEYRLKTAPVSTFLHKNVDFLNCVQSKNMLKTENFTKICRLLKIFNIYLTMVPCALLGCMGVYL